MARLAVYLNTALSMTSCASRWRSTGSCAAGRPSRDIRRARSSTAPGGDLEPGLEPESERQPLVHERRDSDPPALAFPGEDV